MSPLPSARALLGSSREEEEEEEEEEDDDGLAECYQIPLVSSSQLTAECRAIAFSVSALLANGTLGQFTGRSICLLVDLSVYWSTHQSIGQSVSLLVNPSVYWLTRQFTG